MSTPRAFAGAGVEAGLVEEGFQIPFQSHSAAAGIFPSKML